MSILSNNFGGAIIASPAKVTIFNSNFNNNGTAGTIDTYGGAAAYIYQGELTIMDRYFRTNIVGASGGTINAIEAGINIE